MKKFFILLFIVITSLCNVYGIEDIKEKCQYIAINKSETSQALLKKRTRKFTKTKGHKGSLADYSLSEIDSIHAGYTNEEIQQQKQNWQDLHEDYKKQQLLNEADAQLSPAEKEAKEFSKSILKPEAQINSAEIIENHSSKVKSKYISYLVLIVMSLVILYIAIFIKVITTEQKATKQKNIKNNLSNQEIEKIGDKLVNYANLMFFFNDFNQVIKKHINKYEIIDKSNNKTIKNNTILEIIYIELYLYVLFLIISDFKEKTNYSLHEIIIEALNILKVSILLDIDKSNLFEIFNIRSETYSKCVQTIPERSTIESKILINAYQNECIKENIEEDLSSYNKNKKLNDKQLFDSDYYLKYIHNNTHAISCILDDIYILCKGLL